MFSRQRLFWLHQPYDLEGSGFVTLTEIEGEDFRLSGDPMYNMDHISHGGTLLDPESWHFQQYAAFGQDQSPNDVPCLEATAVRYPLEILAQLRAEEWTRTHTNGSSDFQDLGAVEGTDQALYAVRDSIVTLTFHPYHITTATDCMLTVIPKYCSLC